MRVRGSLMVGTGAYQQQIRFALRGLGAQNGQFTFERVCRELARATICQNVVPATGPVGAGGDQGRDFETFPAFLSGRVGDVGSAFGLQDGEAVSFLCTLQQRRIRAKILDEVAKTVGSGEAVHWIVAYCEVDLPVAARHGIEREAKDRHGVRLVIFDGNAIAELLATRPAELSHVVAEWLKIRPEGVAVHVPRDLPRAPLRFVNRERELFVLDRIAGDADEAAGPRVAVLSGMHGVGKSAVGRVWSNRNRERFPGGDLFGDCSKRRLGAAVDLNDMLGGLAPRPRSCRQFNTGGLSAAGNACSKG